MKYFNLLLSFAVIATISASSLPTNWRISEVKTENSSPRQVDSSKNLPQEITKHLEVFPHGVAQLSPFDIKNITMEELSQLTKKHCSPTSTSLICNFPMKVTDKMTAYVRMEMVIPENRIGFNLSLSVNNVIIHDGYVSELSPPSFCFTKSPIAQITGLCIRTNLRVLKDGTLHTCVAFIDRFLSGYYTVTIEAGCTSFNLKSEKINPSNHITQAPQIEKKASGEPVKVQTEGAKKDVAGVIHEQEMNPENEFPTCSPQEQNPSSADANSEPLTEEEINAWEDKYGSNPDATPDVTNSNNNEQTGTSETGTADDVQFPNYIPENASDAPDSNDNEQTGTSETSTADDVQFPNSIPGNASDAPDSNDNEQTGTSETSTADDVQFPNSIPGNASDVPDSNDHDHVDTHETSIDVVDICGAHYENSGPGNTAHAADINHHEHLITHGNSTHRIVACHGQNSTSNDAASNEQEQHENNGVIDVHDEDLSTENSTMADADSHDLEQNDSPQDSANGSTEETYEQDFTTDNVANAVENHSEREQHEAISEHPADSTISCGGQE